MKDESRVFATESDPQSTGSEGDAAGTVTVKKYANRRLYNTATSSYVTLENLAAMARAGTDFVVVDAKTGEDITRSVLTQIIFEEESRGHEPLLPTSFLRQLIRLYGHALQGYVPGYLEATMSAFERNQETFRVQMERSFGQAPGFKQFDAMARANMEMFRNAMAMFSTFSESAQAKAGQATNPADAMRALMRGDFAAAGLSPEAGEQPKGEAPTAAEKDESDKELQALQQELQQMQRKVEALAKKPG